MTSAARIPMVMVVGLLGCALENPEVRVPPLAAIDAATDRGVSVDEIPLVDRPLAADVGFDTGPVDTGPVDTGPLDAGPLDTGPVDTGPLDTGPLDTGPPDTGPLDTGPLDTGPLDTGPLDTGPLDTGPPDTGPADVPLSTTCGALRQGCCPAPSVCRPPLTCQTYFTISSCLPCGGRFQACCAGGECRNGDCFLGICPN